MLDLAPDPNLPFILIGGRKKKGAWTLIARLVCLIVGQVLGVCPCLSLISVSLFENRLKTRGGDDIICSRESEELVVKLGSL